MTLAFRDKKYKRFFPTYLTKCRYVDVYNAALFYCLGIDTNARIIIKLIYGFYELGFNYIIKMLELYLKFLKFMWNFF